MNFWAWNITVSLQCFEKLMPRVRQELAASHFAPLVYIVGNPFSVYRASNVVVSKNFDVDVLYPTIVPNTTIQHSSVHLLRNPRYRRRGERNR